MNRRFAQLMGLCVVLGLLATGAAMGTSWLCYGTGDVTRHLLMLLLLAALTVVAGCSANPLLDWLTAVFRRSDR